MENANDIITIPEPQLNEEDIVSSVDNEEKVYNNPDYGDDDDEEATSPDSCGLLSQLAAVLMPDNYPLSWFTIHLLFIVSSLIFYVQPTDTGNEVPAERLSVAIVPMLLVFGLNLAAHMVLMILRFVLVKGLLERICSSHALPLALLNTLDPSLFYVAFAAGQSLLWQILIKRDSHDPNVFHINLFYDESIDHFLAFDQSSLTWISYSIYIYVILSLRCMVLSILNFMFEMEFLMSSNDIMKKYLKLYAKLRRFNMYWLTYALSKPNIMDELRIVFRLHRFDSITAQFENRKTDRMNNYKILNVFRYRDNSKGQIKKTADAMELPNELTESIINNSSASALQNWMLSHYVTNTDPSISLLHQDIPLSDDNVISKVAELLFDHIYITTNGHDKTKNDSPHTNEISHLYKNSMGSLPYVDRSVPQDNTGTLVSARMPSQMQSLTQSKRSKVASAISFTDSGDIKRLNVSNFDCIRATITSGIERIFNANLKPDYHYKDDYDRSQLFLSRDMLSVFIPLDKLDETIEWMDISCHGKINCTMLQQVLIKLYYSRKKFKRDLKGQQSVFKVLKRLLSVGSWVLSIVVLAYMAGVTIEAIIVSGAAFLSALTVALSYLYTNFITSVIFVAFSNPYNVGDRVRLDGGEILVVKKIRTYTTEFVSMYGKVIIYQNSVLSTMKIVNESRATTATLELKFKVGIDTSDSSLTKLSTAISGVINSRPNDFVKDSALLFVYNCQPGYCYLLGVWFTCIESWANWKRIYQLRTEMYELVIKQCKLCNISYQLPIQPIQFKDSLAITKK